MNLTSIGNHSAIIDSSNKTVNTENKPTVFSATVDEKSSYKNPNIVSIYSQTKDITLDEYKELNQKEGLTPEESLEIAKFSETAAFSDYQRTEALKKGDSKDIETVISIGNDKITIGFDGLMTLPNKYESYVAAGDPSKTLENLYQAFGKDNVSVEKFEEGQGPTNAEFFEQTTGKNYFRHIMSDGRFG